jgi:hypothetical protein
MHEVLQGIGFLNDERLHEELRRAALPSCEPAPALARS